MNKIEAVKAVARNFRDLIIDAKPATLTGTSLDFLRLIQPMSNQLRGKEVYIYAGGGAGQSRFVTSFTSIISGGRVTFEEVFSTIPSTNSDCLMFEKFHKDEYDNFLERMMGMAKLKHLEDKVATLALVATQYEYAVPSGFEYIHSLRLVPSGNSDYGADDYVGAVFEIPPHEYRIEQNPVGTYIIAFDRRKISLSSYDDKWVRIQGQAKPDIAATDNASIPEDIEEYIVNGASMLVASILADQNEKFRTKFYMFRDIHRELEDYIFTPRRGKQVA